MTRQKDQKDPNRERERGCQCQDRRKKVNYFEEFCSIFLLVFVRHVGAYPDGHQHSISMQNFINLGTGVPSSSYECGMQICFLARESVSRHMRPLRHCMGNKILRFCER